MFSSIRQILFPWKVGRHHQHVEAGTGERRECPRRGTCHTAPAALRVGGSTQDSEFGNLFMLANDFHYIGIVTGQQAFR